MPFAPRHLALLATALTLAACQGTPAPSAPSAEPSAAPQPAPAEATTTLDGEVLAPAEWLAAPSGHRVLALAQAPLPNAEVRLTDRHGTPIPGLPSARTDERGRYRFVNLPAGVTYKVVVTVQRPDGTTATLQTIATTQASQNVANLTIATSIAATLATRDLPAGPLGQVPPAAFERTVELIAALLERQPADTLRNDQAALQAVTAALAQQPELQASLSSLQSGLTPPSPAPSQAPASSAPDAGIPAAGGSAGGSGGSDGVSEDPWQATLTTGATHYEGVAAPLKLTVTTTLGSASGAVTATVVSTTEPAGETITLQQTGPGVFTAEVPFQRRYAETGTEQALAADGRIAVYAEGGVVSERLTIRFGTQSATVTYAEPPSTLMGVVRVGGTTRARALLQLDGPDGFKRQTASRADGSYAFYEVPAGTYALTTAVDGAAPLTRMVTLP